MKNLLLLFILICGNSFAQSNYTTTKDAFIYDLPGGDFITAKLINDKTHIKHYDVSGSVIWEDSIEFQGTTGTVLFRSVNQFTGTNECIITMTNDLTNYSDWSQNDTLIYQFTKLDLSTHQFTNSLIDTIFTLGGVSLNYSDTSIYFFLSDRSINNGAYFNYATYSLNSSMQLSLIAPSDSILGFWGWDNRFYKMNDQILYYQKVDEMNFARRFSNSMSQIAQDTLYASTGTDYMSTLFVTPWNNDSLFIFTEGTNPGSHDVKWRFDWNDTYLTPTNSALFSSPYIDFPSTIARYRTGFNRVALDRVNRRIMILADDGSNFNSVEVQKVFVYDYNFNLECEIPITIGSKSTNQLKELNDLVYLKITNSNSTDLVLVDCQSLGIDEFDHAQKAYDIYPNPTSNILFIDNDTQNVLWIEIYSSDGKVVKRSEGSNSKVQIDLSTLENGIYLITIESNGIKEAKRVIKN